MSMYICHKESIHKVLDEVDKSNKYKLTPFIVTFCEGTLTDIDIQSFIEAGLRIVRFKLSHYIRQDKLTLIAMLKSAIKQCCAKYSITAWPIAIMLDLPNACIRTGYICEELLDNDIFVIKNSIVQLTSDTQYWDRCDATRIFIDDPYTMKHILPDTQITINFGTIRMVCTKVVNEKTILCHVTTGGRLGNAQFVNLRNTRLRRPAITKNDMQLISLFKELELDAIMINSIRTPETIKRIRNLFNDATMPIIVSSICDQEGLHNIDSIIAESDGIVLAREFLANAIPNSFRMPAIQLNVCSKCKQAGKPFFISGSILDQMLQIGILSTTELSDVTNAILQGAGLMLRSYADATNLLETMKFLNNLCRTIEPVTMSDNYMNLCDVLQPPVTAADAAVLASAVAARQTSSNAIIVPTVTGTTAIQLSRVAPECIILAVSANETVARQLQFYRGVIPVIYTRNAHFDLKNKNGWEDDMQERVQQALKHCLKYDYLKYNRSYVVLRKSKPTSSYCDEVSVWKVTAKRLVPICIN